MNRKGNGVRRRLDFNAVANNQQENPGNRGSLDDKIKKLQKEITALKQKEKRLEKKINDINPIIDELFKKQVNNNITNKERNDMNKEIRKKDVLQKELKEQQQIRKVKEDEKEKLKRFVAKIKANLKRQNKENKFLKDLNKKATENLNKIAKLEGEITKHELDLKSTEENIETIKESLNKLSKRMVEISEKGQVEFNNQRWYANTSGKYRNTDLYKLYQPLLKTASEWALKRRSLEDESKELKKKIKSMKKQIIKKKEVGTNTPKIVYLYTLKNMLEKAGIKGRNLKNMVLNFDKLNKESLFDKHIDLTELIDSGLLSIPYYRNELVKEGIPERVMDFIDIRPKGIEAILSSDKVGSSIKNYARMMLEYNIGFSGGVQKILNMKIPDKEKMIIFKLQLRDAEVYSLADLNLIKPFTRFNNRNMDRLFKSQKERLILEERVKALKPIIRKKKNIENARRLKNAKITNITPERIIKAIEILERKIINKSNNVDKLRNDYENAKNNNSPKKLAFIKKEINRRNKEINDLVKESSKYMNYSKAATKISKVAKGRLNRKYTNLLKAQKKAENQVKKAKQNIQNLQNTRAGKKNKVENRKRLQEQKKVVNRFLGKLAQNTRGTTKHKYKILTRLMEENAEVNFASEAGFGPDLARVLGRKGLVCHLGGKSPEFVKKYIPSLRESLYSLSVQYLNQYNAKKTNAEKLAFHRQFMNKVVNKAQYPCLEGTFTGITNAIANAGFEWNGQKGYPVEENIGGRKRTTWNPYNVTKQKDRNTLRDYLFAKAMGSYYGTLNKKQKSNFEKASKKNQMRKIWSVIKTKELAHRNFLTPTGEIKAKEGNVIRDTYVDAFKMYANYLYENDKIYSNEELNKMNVEMNKLNKKDLIN